MSREIYNPRKTDCQQSTLILITSIKFLHVIIFMINYWYRTGRNNNNLVTYLHVRNFSFFLFQYIVEKHAKTLLPQYLAVYRITVDNKETYLLVMKSVFSTKFKIHKKYDLKGSTVDRQASSKEKVRGSAKFQQIKYH